MSPIEPIRGSRRSASRTSAALTFRGDNISTLSNVATQPPWPLPAGDYTVHYLLTDQYNSAGSAEFTVEER